MRRDASPCLSVAYGNRRGLGLRPRVEVQVLDPCVHVIELSGGVGDRPFPRCSVRPFVERRGSALTLLVTRVLADHHHTTVPADDLALVADLLDARLNLHSSNLFDQR